MKPKMNQQPLNETHSTNPKYTKQNASKMKNKKPNKNNRWIHWVGNMFAIPFLESVS